MFYYLTSIFNYFFSKQSNDEDIQDEELIASELLKISLESNDTHETFTQSQISSNIHDNSLCFQRTGVITYYDDDNNYILIDGNLFFDTSNCPITLHHNDKVLYLGYYNDDKSIVVVRILRNEGMSWSCDEAAEATLKIDNHIIISGVKKRHQRFVYMADNDLKFNLDDVEGTMVPAEGDILQLTCNVAIDEDTSSISAEQVLKVISFKPPKVKIKSAVITAWDGEYGICDNDMYFNKHCTYDGFTPATGQTVTVEAIENNAFSKYCWRIIKMVIKKSERLKIVPDTMINEEIISLETEKQQNITVTHPINFQNVSSNKLSESKIIITNNSEQTHYVKKWMFLGAKRDSQLMMFPQVTKDIPIYPGKEITFVLKCTPKLLGNSKEHLIILFRGFKVQRIINVQIVQENKLNMYGSNNNYRYCHLDSLIAMKNIRNDNTYHVPAQKIVKPPNFVAVRIGVYNIPNKLWSVFLDNVGQATCDFKANVEVACPSLTRELTIYTYAETWHNLLYLEEINENLSIRIYDMQNVYLLRKQGFLGVEIKDLSERRPSLIVGDKVKVRDLWNKNSTCVVYEGFIHQVFGNLVLMKFNERFHESYSGSDVSIEFHFSRTCYRRLHHAVDQALKNLGPQILFPKRIVTQESRLPLQHTINWFNPNLNLKQKHAIKNIIMGKCRPMPYCIYGPPGTGKTVTVIETILQILANISDSRILVATPSNSAANLITERLIEYKDNIQDSFVRILAHHLADSETIPVHIKRYCATVDLGIDTMSKGRSKNNNGISVNCPMSYIGRHRVTIGTCSSLGVLGQIGFPRGHFTHIIVDEAGQITEPEIMVPLTLTDKYYGQIILAGDPMQLGPLVLSKHRLKLSLEKSFLSRLLEMYPYQKDFQSFSDGFNDLVVTRLTVNYRSLSEVFRVPSQMFYDNVLQPYLDRNTAWVQKILDIMSTVFGESKTEPGGIYVYGVRGSNVRGEDSPSWCNPEEAAMVALVTSKLFSEHVSLHDIGIVTPYVAQIKYLRVLFKRMDLPLPKIGTVEDFQGQERPIIIISTVRSSEHLVEQDLNHSLGFLRCPKRFNVALTRAQVAVLLFCDPHLLSNDPCWERVITQAVSQDKYTGCDLPVMFHKNNDSDQFP